MDDSVRFLTPNSELVLLGKHKNSFELLESLKKADCTVNNFSEQLIGAINLSSAESRVLVTISSLEELGLKDGASYGDICERIRQIKTKHSEIFDLCPTEIAPQICSQKLDRPKWDKVVFLMKPISIELFNGLPLIFHTFRQNDGRRLLSVTPSCHPRFRWSANTRVAFVCKNSES